MVLKNIGPQISDVNNDRDIGYLSKSDTLISQMVAWHRGNDDIRSFYSPTLRSELLGQPDVIQVPQ